jgi:AcrR family transcriptional regulator
MASDRSANSPVGREQVKAALVAATVELCTDHSPGSVGLREIASRAGVNHGQVRNYFGSKAELVAATMESLEHDMEESLAASGSTGEFAERLMRTLSRHPAFAQMLGWLLSLEARPAAIGLEFRFGRALAQRLVAEGADPDEAVVAASRIMIVCAGWPLIRPLLRVSNDLDERAEEAIVDAFAGQVRGIVGEVVPVDRSSGESAAR